MLCRLRFFRYVAVLGLLQCGGYKESTRHEIPPHSQKTPTKQKKNVIIRVEIW